MVSVDVKHQVYLLTGAGWVGEGGDVRVAGVPTGRAPEGGLHGDRGGRGAVRTDDPQAGDDLRHQPVHLHLWSVVPSLCPLCCPVNT